jgi:hypothetical protein
VSEARQGMEIVACICRHLLRRELAVRYTQLWGAIMTNALIYESGQGHRLTQPTIAKPLEDALPRHFKLQKRCTARD